MARVTKKQQEQQAAMRSVWGKYKTPEDFAEKHAERRESDEYKAEVADRIALRRGLQFSGKSKYMVGM